MAAKQYVVTGAYVTVKTETADGPRVVGLYAGAPWPADAPPEATKHHLENSLIEEVGAPAPAPAAAAKEEEKEAKAPAQAASHQQAGRRA